MSLPDSFLQVAHLLSLLRLLHLLEGHRGLLQNGDRLFRLAPHGQYLPEQPADNGDSVNSLEFHQDREAFRQFFVNRLRLLLLHAFAGKTELRA